MTAASIKINKKCLISRFDIKYNVENLSESVCYSGAIINNLNLSCSSKLQKLCTKIG